MTLERCFLDSHAFPMKLHRHLVFSPSRIAASRSPFALIMDSSFEWQRAPAAEKESHLESLALVFARLTLAVDTATELLLFDDKNYD